MEKLVKLMFCYSDLCEKVVLKVLHHLSPKAFHFVVGVSKTLVAFARLKQVFQKGNRQNVNVSAYMLSLRLTP